MTPLYVSSYFVGQKSIRFILRQNQKIVLMSVINNVTRAFLVSEVFGAGFLL